MPSWQAWARTVPVPNRADRVYLLEIARWCDTRGVAHLSRHDLAAVTGVHPVTVSRRLASLEQAGLLRRERIRQPNGQVGQIRIQLVRSAPRSETTWQPPQPLPTARVDTTSKPMGEPTSDSELREILKQIASGNSDAKNRLGGALANDGPRRFRSVMARRNPANSNNDDADTISIAYELAIKKAPIFAEAKSPWALLATYVRTECAHVDQQWWTQEPHSYSIPDNDYTQLKPIKPNEPDTPAWGIDEIEAIPELKLFVDALQKAGMNPALATSGTSRVLTYMQYAAGVRHQLIARDTTLHSLGVSPEQARAWLSAIAGSRRGIGGLANCDHQEIVEGAAKLAHAVNSKQVA